MSPNPQALAGTPKRDGFALSGARFEIGGTPILHPVSVEIPNGQVTGLVGANGSGKSTLLKILARQLAPSGGAVHLDGEPLSSWRARGLARRIAYLPQHPQTATGLPVRKVVALGRYPWHGPFGRFSPADHIHVDDAMRQTGTSDLADRDLDTLSGGERQRVWLAMLVAQDARCLLLDEPTSALDVVHQIEVLSLVRRLTLDARRCVVVVLHDVNMASRFCDRILALRKGRLVADTEIRDFMTPQRLHEVYGHDMEIFHHSVHPFGFAIPN